MIDFIYCLIRVKQIVKATFIMRLNLYGSAGSRNPALVELITNKQLSASPAQLVLALSNGDTLRLLGNFTLDSAQKVVGGTINSFRQFSGNDSLAAGTFVKVDVAALLQATAGGTAAITQILFGANDAVTGSDGDDQLTMGGIPGDGPELLDGGAGVDTLRFDLSAFGDQYGYFAGSPGASVASVRNGSGQYVSTRLVSVENVVGSHNDDFIFLARRAAGLAGEDQLRSVDVIDYSLDDAAGGHAGIMGDLRSKFIIDGFGDRDEVLYTPYFPLTQQTVIMTAHDDTMLGSNISDRLEGRGGDDVLKGWLGDDILIGGVGGDMLTGGGGADRFRFEMPQDGGDLIVDFHRAQGDRIEIVGAQFGLTPGAKVRMVSGADPQAFGTIPMFLYDTDTHVLSFDRDGGRDAAAVELAVVANVAALHFYDIVVI